MRPIRWTHAFALVLTDLVRAAGSRKRGVAVNRKESNISAIEEVLLSAVSVESAKICDHYRLVPAPGENLCGQGGRVEEAIPRRAVPCRVVRRWTGHHEHPLYPAIDHVEGRLQNQSRRR